MHHAQFRFYEELNDFLPPEKQKISFTYEFNRNPSIKDVIEALGVPHTEVDLILVNGRSVDFRYLLCPGDQVAVYPRFESLDITHATHLRAKPLRETKFILDVHLGKLAKHLRLLGFDTLYANHFEDEYIIAEAQATQRIILTRDKGILKNKKVTHGYWVRATDPKEQIIEIIQRFDLLDSIVPFTHCIACNGLISKVDKNKVLGKIPEKARDYYQAFYQCETCQRVYWKGTHYKKLQQLVEKLMTRDKM